MTISVVDTTPRSIVGESDRAAAPVAVARTLGLAARSPGVIFTTVYLFSCYVGVLALAFSVRFRTLYFIFSGSDPVLLSRRDLIVMLVLINVVPAVMWLGYELMIRYPPRFRQVSLARDEYGLRLIARVAFPLSVLGACWSLGRVGGLGASLTAWFNYNAYVFERWRWFDSLGFFEFVNLYTLLPIFAVALLLSERRRWLGAGAVALVLALQYPLAIRKVLLTTLLLAGFSGYIYWTFGEHPRRLMARRRHMWLVSGGAVTLYAVYIGLTLMTVLGPHAQAFHSIDSLVPAAQMREAAARRLEDEQRMAAGSGLEAAALESGVTDEAVAKVLDNRVSSVALYTALSPLTRSSICALVYPAIFPRWHPYYPLDLGFDILGFGAMPDDNLVVYKYLWPEHHRGSVAAPFHIVLYSQGGLVPALVGALVIGVLLALAWSRVTASVGPPSVLASLWGGLILTLSAFLAIDSLRNSLLVSYGLVWGMLALAVLQCGGWVVSRRTLVGTIAAR